MLLLEHDAKQLLASSGVLVPEGVLVSDDAFGALSTAGPWVVKAQVPVGGRGKAGGIRTAATLDELRQQVRAILGMTLKGHIVRACRIERQVSGHEAYISLSVDPAEAGIRLLLSAEGGVDIETSDSVRSALAAPDRASVIAGFAELAQQVPAAWRVAVLQAADRLTDAFFQNEATLVEVNPLFIADDGSWLAGDAKMILDANAMPRQPIMEQLARDRRDAYPETFLKLNSGFDYVEIDPLGEIGMVTTGAGLSMMLIDELTARGLRPFNFLDIRTGQMRGDPRRLIEVLSWMHEAKAIKVVLVSVFAGITHLGEFAELLVQAMRAVPELRVPVVARIIGNGFDDARAIIAASGMQILVEPDLDLAIAEAARVVKASSHAS